MIHRVIIIAFVSCVFTIAWACSRRTEIVDEAVGGSDLGGPTVDAGGIPAVDAGLDAFGPCSERPPGDCQGPVDFPCAVSDWVETTALRCQRETGCVTNGTLEITLGDEGCVVVLGMDQPNDAIIACLAAELGAYRCPCEAGTVSYFFGLGNEGTCPAECSTEFPCDDPLKCVDGMCVP